MKVELLSRDEESATFLIKGANTGLMNALRRIVISEVPVFAVEELYIYENDSPLWDEFIAHRVGLIPLKAEYGTYTPTSEVMFQLDVTGPAVVTAAHLKPSDPSVVPVDDKIVIVKLMDGQRLRFDAKARVGTAREHAKFQAGLASYRHVYRVEIKDEEAVRKGGGDPAKIREESSSTAGLSDASLSLLKDVEEEQPGAVNLYKNPDQFIFYVETYGNLPLRDLLRAAFDVLEEKIKEVEEEI